MQWVETWALEMKVQLMGHTKFIRIRTHRSLRISVMQEITKRSTYHLLFVMRFCLLDNNLLNILKVVKEIKTINLDSVFLMFTLNITDQRCSFQKCKFLFYDIIIQIIGLEVHMFLS